MESLNIFTGAVGDILQDLGFRGATVMSQVSGMLLKNWEWISHMWDILIHLGDHL